jgi:hypothetical protein
MVIHSDYGRIQNLGLHLKILTGRRKPFSEITYSSVMCPQKFWPAFVQACSREEGGGVQCGALHPLQIWLHPLGICNIKDKHADLK